MKESIPPPITTVALMRPMTMPARIVRTIARTMGTPWLTSSHATMTLRNPMALPTQRSNTRADSGTTGASAMIPEIAFWLRTVWPPPALGEHTDEVLREAGMTAS
jgi:crotonobetainyl-CoA:carnitine CoA-transferase CaiB-like acyl-CoA transferase